MRFQGLEDGRHVRSLKHPHGPSRTMYFLAAPTPSVTPGETTRSCVTTRIAHPERKEVELEGANAYSADMRSVRSLSARGTIRSG